MNIRIMGAVGITVLILAAIVAISLASPPAIDPQTGCPTEPGHTRNTVFILLDTTDRVSPAQARHIENTVFGVIDAAGAYTRIKVFEILPSTYELQAPFFDHCKPEIDNPYASPIIQKFEELRFNNVLQEIFNKDRPESLPTSPIIQAIGSVAAYFDGAEGSVSFIIASDFIENSELLNQYSPDWETAARTDARTLQSATPQINGVHLSMLFIPRPQVQHHNQSFAAWWRRYLTESGADISDQTFPVNGCRRSWLRRLFGLQEESCKTYTVHAFRPITGI